MATASPKPKAAVRAFATASMAGRATIVPNINVTPSALSMANACLVTAFAIRAGRATIVPNHTVTPSALSMANAFLVSANAMTGL